MNIRCRADSFYRAVDAVDGPVSLYLHFPFCVRKCRYCDFLSGPADEETRQRLADALCREIRQKAEWLRRSGLYGTGGEVRTGRSGLSDLSEKGPGLPQVDTIFFGGGTPSLMSPRQLDRLLSVIADCFLIDDDAEITLECNPGTADYVKLRDFGRLGVNRLSIGVQSFREEELRLLGRIHTAEDARRCVQDARRAGFMNLSLDLMSALPGQTYEQWMENLTAAAALEPEHLSAYSLILEEGTPLREDDKAGCLPPLPDEEEDRRMYHDTKTFLAAKGYHRYEISNYAFPGFESRHNNGYWTGHPYLGFGPGASSYLILPLSEKRTGAGTRIRFRNPELMDEYVKTSSQTCEGLPDDVEFLSREDQMAEFFFLGLRRVRGVSEVDFRAEFGCPVDEVYGPVLRRYAELGFLRREDGRIALTDPGLDVSNTIMADFLL